MTMRIPMILLLMVFSSVALAQSYGSREGRWEGSFLVNYQNGQDESYQSGAAIDIDSVAGWGFTFGWNWTSKLNLSYSFMINKPNYSSVVVPDEGDPKTIDHKLSKYSNHFNATYNFLDGDFTPFVTGGLGWTKLDSNVADGPPVGGCWWDPWWGYVCYQSWNTYSKTEFTYKLGAGLRWDFDNSMFTRAAYTREFVSVKGGDLNFDMATLEIGWMF